MNKHKLLVQTHSNKKRLSIRSPPRSKTRPFPSRNCYLSPRNRIVLNKRAITFSSNLSVERKPPSLLNNYRYHMNSCWTTWKEVHLNLNGELKSTIGILAQKITPWRATNWTRKNQLVPQPISLNPNWFLSTWNTSLNRFPLNNFKHF